MKLRMQESGGGPVANEVCESCYRSIGKSASHGALLRAEAHAKEQGRVQMWKSRMNLIKQAKQLMAQKLYSDAAVAYEKYLRILELVLEKEVGALSPDLFSNEAGKQELTVITSVYWDLMRIYDVNDRYKERQMKAAAKLADFARFTPIFPNLIRKAEAQTRSAKNPEAYRHFIQLASEKRGRCFIATAAFNGHTREVETLCRFRDEILLPRPWGRFFIRSYYFISPKIAAILDANPEFKPPVRKALAKVAFCVGKIRLNHSDR